MSDDADIDVQMLEPLLRDFVRLIGLPATMTLVDRYGGTLLNIARKADQTASLVALIGPEAAAALGREYGGTRPLIPKARRALAEARARRVRAALRTKSVREVAREFRLSERRIWQLAEAIEDPTGQLF